MSAIVDADNAMDVDYQEESAEAAKASTINTLPWIEKYRPKSLNELIAHEEIVNILNKLIESNKLPHLLFHGPPGTGIRF